MASHQQERKTSAGASMTTKEGCQNSSTSPLNSNAKKINALKLRSLKKYFSKSGTCPPCRPSVTHTNKEAHIEINGSPRSEEGTTCSTLYFGLQARPHFERRNPGIRTPPPLLPGTLNTVNEGTQRLRTPPRREYRIALRRTSQSRCAIHSKLTAASPPLSQHATFLVLAWRAACQ